MRKILPILLIFFFSNIALAKDATIPLDGGYVGTLPDVTQGFQKSVPAVARPEFETSPGFNTPNEIKPTPRDNPAFVNIILQKDKTSQYTKDINTIIPIIEKIMKSIEDKENNQRFAAKVYFLNNYVDLIRRRYENRSESNYTSFLKLMEANMQAMSVATLRMEGQIYSPYLAYTDSGYIYNPINIEQQLEYLLKELQETVVILKETN